MITLTRKYLITSGLLKTTDYNTNVAEIECKIPNITGLTTTCPYNAVEKKIPSVSYLVKTTVVTQKY